MSEFWAGSSMGSTSSTRDTGKFRPLTEAAPTWRNTPSWESNGWYSRGSLLDSATDAQVAPVRQKGVKFLLAANFCRVSIVMMASKPACCQKYGIYTRRLALCDIPGIAAWEKPAS